MTLQRALHTVASILLLLGLIGCSSNDDATTNSDTDNTTADSSGQIVINSVSYPYDRGYLISDTNKVTGGGGANPDSFYLVLANAEIGLAGGGGLSYADEVTQYAIFLLYSSEGDGIEIEETTYPYADNIPDFDYSMAYMNSARFDVNAVFENGEFVTSDGDGSANMDRGGLTLTQNGAQFRISFNFSNSTKTITGSYNGILESL